MEDTLGVQRLFSQQVELKSLNPCFNGRYSRSRQSPFVEGLKLKS